MGTLEEASWRRFTNYIGVISTISLWLGNKRLALGRCLTVISHSFSTMWVFVTVVILAARAGEMSSRAVLGDAFHSKERKRICP